MESVCEGEDRPGAVLPDCQRSDLSGYFPCTDLCAFSSGTENTTAFTVNPIQPLGVNVPQRSFTQLGLDVNHNIDLRHYLSFRLRNTFPPGLPSNFGWLYYGWHQSRADGFYESALP